MDRTPGTKALASTSMMATVVALVLAIGIAMPASAAAATTEPAASPGVAPAPEPGPAESSSPADIASAHVSNAFPVLSTEELSSVFARLAMAGGQAMVVADTTIRRDVPKNQLRCAPPGRPRPRACPIGVVEPGAPGRGLMPVVARKSARMAIPGDRSPVEGTMGYRIDGERLELLGPVGPSTASPLVAVDPEAMAAADSLPVGSLIAVDGWLGVLGSDATCPAAPELADTSSPFAVCPAGWITASDGVPSDASGELALTPDDFGIRVQSGAYEDFAPDGQTAGPAGQPRRATYLLRRVRGGSAEDPALGWKVIGRVDPVEGAGSPTVTAEERGLLLELWLDQATIPVGARLTGLARVSNVGQRTPHWESNICGTGPAPTTIELGRPEETGIAWTGQAATFKRKLLENELRPEFLVDGEAIDIENAACDAYSAVQTFGPGSVSQMVIAWDATDRLGRPTIPGIATVTSTVEMWKPRTDPQAGRPNDSLAASTTIEITGEQGSAVPVALYADAALSDDAFRAWVERQQRPRSWTPSAHYWPNDDGNYPREPRYQRASDGAVDIGMFGPGPVGEATIDTTTFEVLGRRLQR